MADLRRPCRCGLRRDEHSLCPHCDRIPAKPCHNGCARCEYRDAFCPICRTNCNTTESANAHERACRQAEIDATKQV